MQTFLPYPSFTQSARCLDRLRLGKQRLEVMQILGVLSRSGVNGRSGGYSNHPAVKMWSGYEGALALYGVAVCLEWRRRGYKDKILELVKAGIEEVAIGAARVEAAEAGTVEIVGVEVGDGSVSFPPWLGDPAFHLAHRSNLIRKDREYYGGLPGFEGVPDDLPYVWPV